MKIGFFFCLPALFLALPLSAETSEPEDSLYCNPLNSIEKLDLTKSWKPEIVSDGGGPCLKTLSGGTFGVWVTLPEGETVEFSIDMKWENVTLSDPTKHWCGATFKGMTQTTGEATRWPGCCFHGSHDWKRVAFKVNSPLDRQTRVWVRCGLEGAEGTAWYRNLAVKVVK